MEKRFEKKFTKSDEQKEYEGFLDKQILGLREPGVDELLRLLESDKFEHLTQTQIYEIGDYHSIEIEGEVFFEEPFSTSKEARFILELIKNGQVDKAFVIEKLKDVKENLG